MKSILSLLLVSSFLVISCKKELEPQDSSATANTVPFTEVGKQMQNQNSTPPLTPQNTNVVNQNNAVPASTTVAKGMNPAHGQPGHRCEIPVGAPLNSPAPANKTVSPQIVPQQNNPVSTNAVTTNPSPAATTPTPEGMNPPHGQDKHRCDIAVGAPLPKA